LRGILRESSNSSIQQEACGFWDLLELLILRISKSNSVPRFGLNPTRSEDFARNLQQLQSVNSPILQPAQEFHGNPNFSRQLFIWAVASIVPRISQYPGFLDGIEVLDRSCRISHNQAVGRKTLRYQRIRCDYTMVAKNQLAFIAQDRGSLADETTLSDSNSATCRNTLAFDRHGNVFVRGAVVPDQYRLSERDFPLQMDRILSANCGPWTDVGRIIQDDDGSALFFGWGKYLEPCVIAEADPIPQLNAMSCGSFQFTGVIDPEVAALECEWVGRVYKNVV
jgi:hypothetical protein